MKQNIENFRVMAIREHKDNIYNSCGDDYPTSLMINNLSRPLKSCKHSFRLTYSPEVPLIEISSFCYLGLNCVNDSPTTLMLWSSSNLKTKSNVMKASFWLFFEQAPTCMFPSFSFQTLSLDWLDWLIWPGMDWLPWLGKDWLPWLGMDWQPWLEVDWLPWLGMDWSPWLAMYKFVLFWNCY